MSHHDAAWLAAREVNKKRFPHQYRGRLWTNAFMRGGSFITSGRIMQRPTSDPKVSLPTVVNQPPYIATVIYEGKEYKGRNALKRKVRAERKAQQKQKAKPAPVPSGKPEKHSGARVEEREAMLRRRRREKRHKRRAEARELAEMRASL